MYSNYFFVKNTTFLARQYNWSNMFNTIITCRLSHYFRLKTCLSFLSHSHVFHLMFVINYVTVLSGKYPANFTRIPDSTGCLHFTGYRIVLSGSGTSLVLILQQLASNGNISITVYYDISILSTLIHEYQGSKFMPSVLCNQSREFLALLSQSP